MGAALAEMFLQALAGGNECFLAGGKGKPQVTLAGLAEARARDGGDPNLFEKFVLKGLRPPAGVGDVRKGVERTARRRRR